MEIRNFTTEAQRAQRRKQQVRVIPNVVEIRQIREIREKNGRMIIRPYWTFVRLGGIKNGQAFQPTVIQIPRCFIEVE